jgi:hypothetical protein
MGEALTIIIKGDNAQFTRTMNQVDSAIKKANGTMSSFGHTGVSSMQAASASIRLVEGDITRNTRAVEKFISTIPGVSNLLRAAFPLVGGLAFAGMIAKVGIEFAKAIQQAQRMPQVFQNATQAFTVGQQEANAQLAITNDNLEKEIAKIEHKPFNGTKFAMDEAALSAAKLYTSVSEANSKIDELLDKGAMSFTGTVANLISAAMTGDYGQIVTNAGVTPNVKNRIHAQNQNLQSLQYQSDQGLNYHPDRGPIFLQDDRARSQYLDEAKKQASSSVDLQNSQAWQSQVMNLSGQQKQQQLESQKVLDEGNLTKAQQGALALQNQKKADAQQIQDWHDQLDSIKAMQDLSLGDEGNYWITKAASVKGGSANYKKALDEANKDLAGEQKELAKQNLESVKLGTTTSQGGKWDIDKDFESRNSDSTKGLESQAKATETMLKAMRESVDITHENTTAWDLFSIELGVTSGRITQHEAALDMAASHTKTYTEQVIQLNAQLANLQRLHASGALTDIDYKGQSTQVKNQLDTLNGQRNIQSAQDTQAIYKTTFSGMIEQMTSEWGDMTRQIATNVVNSIDSLNSSLANSLTQQLRPGQTRGQVVRQGLSNSLRSDAAGFTKTGLQGLEKMGGSALDKIPGMSGLMGKLGLGTGKMGTQSNPMYVKAVDGMGSGSGSGGFSLSHLLSGGNLSGLTGMLNPGMSSAIGAVNAGNAAISSMDTTLPALTDMIPFLASGGDVTPGNPYVVGDGGKPELFVPDQPGHVHPDASMFGGSGGQNIYIDAKGTDPALSMANFQRALQHNHAQSVKDATHMASERQRRVPR